MKKSLAAFALAALASQAAFAAPTAYTVDGSHTFPRFEYNHLGFSNQVHRFTKTSGTVVWDREAKTGSVDIVIDATSVDTGHALFNQHIQGEDFFHTAKYPKITFKSTRVKFDGERPVAIEGELTIKDITRPVTLAVTSFLAKPHPMLRKDALGANATAKVSRADFNVHKNVPFVSDEVTLSISIEAVAAE